MNWRSIPIAVLLFLRPPQAGADSILDEITLIDPYGDQATLGLTFDAAGNSIYSFVDPSSNPNAYAPPDVDLTAGLLDLILSLDTDPANLAPLFAPGAVFSGLVPDFTPVYTAALTASSITAAASPDAELADQAIETPEPDTLILFSGWLLIFVARAIHRLRQARVPPAMIRGEPSRNEPLHRTDPAANDRLHRSP